MYTKGTLTCLLACVISFNAVAKPDKAGSDHPLISRYANSYIKQYTQTDYDEFELATAPMKPGLQRPPVKRVEGKITTIIYETNAKTESVIKVFRNYTNSLNQAGFKKIFTCTGQACGPNFVHNLIVPTHRKTQYSRMDPYNVEPHLADFRYWSGVLEKGNKKAYASIIVKTRTFGNYPVEVALDIAEPEQMQTGLVTIDVNSLTDAIKNHGKAVLKGIYFDHDMAVVKPESKPALDTIATYLRNNPSVRVYIVGHTDNTGSDQHNTGLSKRRAQAVIDKLVREHRIPLQRLKAYGIGPVAPVTTNATKSGRAENRRVEIVLMSQ